MSNEHGGAPRGNQNHRTLGWTSRINPTPISEITAAADAALTARDLPTLRRAERALRWRGEHESAKYCRDSIEVITASLRESRQPAKSTPYLPTRRDTPPQVIPPTEAPRIARGYRRT